MKLKRIKRFFSVFLAASLALTSVTGFASVLGSSKINGYTMKIGEGTYFTHNVFFSDQSGVGQQSENYIIYEPNESVTPIITNGTSLFGTTSISKEAERLKAEGIDILGGTNADFFSLQTGVPMSNAIVDGKILTKDASGQDGIGIFKDGTAFISYFTLASVLIKEDGSETNIYNINKYRQPYSIYMMTRDFSDSTHNTTKGLDVILGSVEGEMKLGTQMTAVVEAINETDTSAPIPEDKIVITVDSNAPAEFYDPIASLAVGEKVTLSFGVIGDARWKDVKMGMGSVGGRLLINGEVNPNLEAGAAPRTAIGVKEDGSMVIYTIDGRQNGHSYGVQLKTLAKRMQELGCIDAINLDGGGSTSIICRFPGDESTTLANKPSDGWERTVSTFMFFKNNAEKTGIASMLHFYPKSNYVLTGAQLQLTLKATDSGYHAAEVPENIQFSVEDGKNSIISGTGMFTAADNGTVTVFAEKDGIKTSVPIVCLASPTDIVVKDKATGKALKSISLSTEESIELTADAYGGYNKLTAQENNFSWKADNSIGTIDESNVFTASNKPGASGNIYVTAGDRTVEIPVKIDVVDETNPDAYPNIEMNLEYSILSGKISCKYDIPTLGDGLLLQCDGREHSIEYDEETGEFTADIDESVNRITLYATNSLGYTNSATVSASNEFVYQNPFSDTAEHWAEDVLSYMYGQKIVSGENVDGILKFNPQKEMTRSEFAVMIANYLGLSANDYSDTVLPYTDVNTIPAWALNSFKALYAHNIMNGRYVSDTESCADPLASITRAEAATIVARTLPSGFFKVDITAPDKNDIPSWAYDGVNTLIKLGAVNGYEDGTLLPMRKLTKAEAAKILYSVM